MDGRLGSGGQISSTAGEKRLDMAKRILTFPPSSDRQIARPTNDGKLHIPTKISIGVPRSSQPQQQRSLFPSLQRTTKLSRTGPLPLPGTPSAARRLPLFERFKSATPAPSLRKSAVKALGDIDEEDEAILKPEPFSDGLLPPSSPPPDIDIVEQGSTNSDDIQRPLIPQPPLAEQRILLASPMFHSTPRSSERRRSSTSQVDCTNVDVPETDFHEISMKALKDVAIYQSQLRDQRNQMQSLSMRLEDVTSAHSVLQSQLTSAQSDLQVARQQIKESEESRASAQEGLSESQSDLLSYREQLKKSNLRVEATEAELNELKGKLHAAEDGLKAARSGSQAKLLEARGRVEHMGNELLSMKAAFDALKATQEASQSEVRQFRELREEVNMRLQRLGNVINDQGRLICGQETKNIVHELKDELENSHRVNDILRDKLYDISAQLANAQTRVQEMEGDERMALLRFIEEMKQGEDRADLQEQFIKIADKLNAEKWVADESAVVAAHLEEQLKIATARIAELGADLEKTKTEHITKIEEQKKHHDQLLESKAAIELRLQEVSEESRSRQERCHLLKQKAEDLAMQVKTSTDAHGISDAKLVQSELHREELTKQLLDNTVTSEKLKDRVKLMEDALIEGKAEKKALQTKHEMALIRLSEVEAEQASLRRTLDLEREKSRQADARASDIQNKLDTQALTLRLTKEQFGDCQEQLSLVQRASNQLADLIKDKDAEIPRLISAASEALKKGHEEIAQKLDAFRGQDEKKYDLAEVNWKKAENQWDGRREALQKRAEVAERAAADASDMIKDLKTRVQDAGEGHAAALSMIEANNAEVVKHLRAEVERIHHINGELVAHASTLVERYHARDLSNPEKDLVEFLLRQSESLHEQDLLSKENELRRRENMVNTLQTRVKELETHLAKTLRGKNTEEHTVNTPMVDLRVWAKSSSSPPKPDGAQVQDPQEEPPTPDADPSSPSPPPRTRARPPLRALDLNAAESISSFGVASQLQSKADAKKDFLAPSIPASACSGGPPSSKTFMALDMSDVDSDADDDIPLSEVSNLTWTSLGKHDRSPEPARTVTKKRVVEAATKKAVNKGSSGRPGFSDYSPPRGPVPAAAATKKKHATSTIAGAGTKGRKKRK